MDKVMKFMPWGSVCEICNAINNVIDSPGYSQEYKIDYVSKVIGNLKEWAEDEIVFEIKRNLEGNP